MTIKTKTDITPYAGRRNWYVAGFCVALVTLLVTGLLAWQRTLTGWELRLFEWINGWPEGLQTFFRIVSVSRNGLMIAAIAVVLAFVLRHWRLAWRLAASSVAGAAVAFVLKEIIGRARPEGLIEQVHLRWTDSGAGFPSGHVTIMTIVMLTILPYLPVKWRWTVPVAIILMGLSRTYLGLHAPLDIIGGFAIGVAVVSFVRIMPQPLRVFFRLD